MHLRLALLTSAIVVCYSKKTFSLSTNETTRLPLNHYYQPNVITSKPNGPITIDVPPLVLPVNFNFWSQSRNDFLSDYLKARSANDDRRHHKTIQPSPAEVSRAHSNEIAQPQLNGQIWVDANRLNADLLVQDKLATGNVPLNDGNASAEEMSGGQEEEGRQKWFVAIPLFYLEAKPSNSPQVAPAAKAPTNPTASRSAAAANNKYVPLVAADWSHAQTTETSMPEQQQTPSDGRRKKRSQQRRAAMEESQHYESRRLSTLQH